ncbi:tail protein X [Vibrio crassostreae]|uniref:tail protein X n=1 Tax=Vibrio crassostreae TaxID=246167 RepID=UPI001B317579|nr:tail protein X [Vibrio crassostreae]
MNTLIARQSERWEQICYRAYSVTNQTLVDALFDANRELTRAMTSFTFSGGEIVNIPAVKVVNTVTVETPPWA